MPDTDPNEFTEREKFVLSYFRYRDLSGSRNIVPFDIFTIALSVTCLGLAFAKDDIALGFVAYTLIFGRYCYLIIAGQQWAKDYQSIFRKYEARLKAAEEAQKLQKPE